MMFQCEFAQQCARGKIKSGNGSSTFTRRYLQFLSFIALYATLSETLGYTSAFGYVAFVECRCK